MSPGALQRLIREARAQPPEAAERCELCGQPLPDDHRHLVDTDEQAVLCTCRPCTLLFGREQQADEGRYRLVPRRRVRLEPVPTDRLGVPVGLAFFVPQSDGTVLAHYPGPAGPARWEVDAEAWHALCDLRPELRTMRSDVEALLVNTVRGQSQHWIVPLTDSLRVVALVRREWRGLSGGSRVWPAIEQFFAELTEQR
ncbi:DUF5947 family protein [Kitasatospora sp. RB6PN24]|uniref:DUF5947 family protein n=1 Tax=Kitasatospora humi TaxID=2893891 RepID=UPI001E4D33DE|nr:DUF5947 family protein [Kitasatospora humi]MCC9307764.1 DUF5947 family protein [Kitasatospora humi]